MPLTWAYKLNLYDNEDTEICVVCFDTVGEMDEYIQTIFDDEVQGDCYYQLTDWLGNMKRARFTTREDFLTRWVEDFYFIEEKYLSRLEE